MHMGLAARVLYYDAANAMGNSTNSSAPSLAVLHHQVLPLHKTLSDSELR